MYHYIMITEKLSGIKHEEKGLSRQKPLKKHTKSYNENASIRMHYHSSYEINICNNMSGMINIEGESFVLEGLQVIFLPPDTLHSYRIKPGTGSIEIWHLRLDYFPLINSSVVTELMGENGFSLIYQRELLYQVNTLLQTAMEGKAFNRSSAVFRLFDLFQKDTIVGKNYHRNQFLHRIIDWTEQNFSNEITLDLASKALFLSKYHFSRKFKESTGSTYMEYLSNLRLEHSLDLLETGEPVGSVAVESGFGDVSYFIRKFKQAYGRTPLQYQKNFNIK